MELIYVCIPYIIICSDVIGPIFAKPTLKLFDSAKVMFGQTVNGIPGYLYKQKCRSIAMKDKFLTFDNCRFVEWLFKFSKSNPL